jgi:hypothetical protein
VGEIYYLSEKIIRPLKIKKIRVVTSSFHMDRCLEIYNKVFGNNIEIIPERTFSKLDTDPLLNARVQKREKASLDLFRTQFINVTPGNPESFEKALYTKHKLYSALAEEDKIRFHKEN